MYLLHIINVLKVHNVRAKKLPAKFFFGFFLECAANTWLTTALCKTFIQSALQKIKQT